MSEIDEDEPQVRINMAPEEDVLENRDPKEITANMVKVLFFFFLIYLYYGQFPSW